MKLGLPEEPPKIRKNKRQSGSKKGTPFERTLAKQLSLWWTNGADDGCIWRTSQSGGRSTSRAKAGKSADFHCSDLCAVSPVAEPLFKVLLFECKRGYNNATLHDLLDKPANGKKCTYLEWIEKAEEDRQRSGALHWCIIHMRDRRDPIMITNAHFLDMLQHQVSDRNFGLPVSRFVIPDKNVLIALPLSSFLKNVEPNQITRILDLYKPKGRQLP